MMHGHTWIIIVKDLEESSRGVSLCVICLEKPEKTAKHFGTVGVRKKVRKSISGIKARQDIT